MRISDQDGMRSSVVDWQDLVYVQTYSGNPARRINDPKDRLNSDKVRIRRSLLACLSIDVLIVVVYCFQKPMEPNSYFAEDMDGARGDEAQSLMTFSVKASARIKEVHSIHSFAVSPRSSYIYFRRFVGRRDPCELRVPVLENSEQTARCNSTHIHTARSCSLHSLDLTQYSEMVAAAERNGRPDEGYYTSDSDGCAFVEDYEGDESSVLAKRCATSPPPRSRTYQTKTCHDDDLSDADSH